MNIEQLIEYCLAKKGVKEDFPFDENTLALKVIGKIFLLTDVNHTDNFTVNLKCDPDYAVELREKHPEIQPGFHMNKKHWNTVDFNGALSQKFLKELIDHSYNMVVKGMTKIQKEELAKL